jgi:PadR family transcriptional regulator, regulatory protein PadR
MSYLVREMASAYKLGSLEELLLNAIQLLGDNAYGVSVFQKAQEIAEPRRVSFGSIYPTLERLEAKGFVSSFRGEPTPERGGRAKRFFRLEALGERALAQSHERSQKILGELGVAWQ